MPPCHVLAPELETLASGFADRVKVVKVDVEAEPELAQAFGVLGIPTVVHFSPDGKEVARSTGTVSAEELARRLALSRYDRAAS